MKTIQSTFRRYLLSSLTTFLTAGVTALAMQLSATSIQWTSTFWFAVGAVVARAGFKAVVEAFVKKNADVVK